MSQVLTHALVFEDGKRHGDVFAANDTRDLMDASMNFGLAHSLGDARVATIQQTHDAASLGALDRHDRALRTAVHEGLQGNTVHFHGHVQHHHGTEGLQEMRWTAIITHKKKQRVSDGWRKRQKALFKKL